MKVKDPVCGMEIDPDAADATETYEGRPYHFCSTYCHEMFRHEPSRYATDAHRESEQSMSGHPRGKSGRGCCG